LKKIQEYTKNKPVLYLPKEDILEHLLSIILKDDLVITLGAGDIVKVSDALAQKLK